MLLRDVFTHPPTSSLSRVAVVIVEAKEQELSAEQVVGLQAADSQHINSAHQGADTASKSERSWISAHQTRGNADKLITKNIYKIVIRFSTLQKRSNARRHRHHHHHSHTERRHSRPETVQEEIEELEDSPSLMYKVSSTVDVPRHRSHRHRKKRTSSATSDRYNILF